MAKPKKDESIADWLRKNEAVESVKYDEDTGEPYRCFTISLDKINRKRPAKKLRD